MAQTSKSGFQWAPLSEKQLGSITDSTARINIWEGAVRSGKTIGSILRWIEFIKNGPPGELLMIGKTERTLQRNILDVIGTIVGQKNYKFNRGTGEVYIYGRRIYVAGANDERSEGKIRGMTLAGAYGDEVTLWPESFFKMLLSRLSVRGAKLFITTNPDGPYHWFKTDYLDNTEINKRVFHFTLDDNLALDPEYVSSLKKEYSGLWYKRFIDGLWVLAEGLIYDMFDDEANIIEKVPSKEFFDRWYVSIDYGTQNPTVFGKWGRHKKTGIWIKVDEYHYEGRAEIRQKTDEEYAIDLDKFCEDIRWDPNFYGVIIDPSAASFRALLDKKQYIIKEANNDVLDGIRNVANALQNQMIMYASKCKQTFQEYASYVWDQKAAERGEDKPLKKRDHHMDGDRYFVNTILYGSGSQIF